MKKRGHTAFKYCIRCHVFFVPMEKIPPQGHDWETTVTPADYKTGMPGASVEKCKKCGKTVTITIMPQHDFDANGKCKVCGYEP